MKKQKSNGFVFAEDWLPAIESVEDREEQLKLWQHVAHYGLHGEETPELNAQLRPVAMLIKSAIDRAHKKYEDTCERRRVAAEDRWQRANASKGIQTDAKDANGTSAYNSIQKDAKDAIDTIGCNNSIQKDAKDANAPEKEGTSAYNSIQKDAKNTIAFSSMHNDNDNEHDNDNDNEHDNDVSSDKSSETIKSPQSPPRGGGGGEKGFWDFFERVRGTVIPAAVQEVNYDVQYRWRAADGNADFVRVVLDAIGTKNLTGLALEDFMRGLFRQPRFQPHTEFKAYRLAEALLTLDANVAAAVCCEADRAAGETGLWDTLLEKVAYIKSEGKKITSLQAFLRCRKASKAASGTKKSMNPCAD
ncbi:MAG: DUF6291 domain-containing protein [Bacteroidales bacterium]|nr:DUF6291 domain-containing protein [Bacteroidales bacterium]